MTHALTKAFNKQHLLLASVIVLGGLLRLLPVLRADFPVNDGGLFYTMTKELIGNGFVLPPVTDWNHSGLPYAYPPLGLYLAGLISVFFDVPLLEVFRYFPAAISMLAIPAFYLLARDIFEEETHALLATLIFAIQPRTAVWHVMGGGVTRSLGLLFAVLTLWQLRRTYHSARSSHILLSVLFSGLLVVSHLEHTLYTVLTIVLYLLFHRPARRQWFVALIIGAGVLVVTSWWWGTVLIHHGLAPFRNALLGSGAPKTLPVLLLRSAFFLFPENYEIDVHLLKALTVLGLIGVYKRKQGHFYLMWLLILALPGRGSPGDATIPIALIITEGFIWFNRPGTAGSEPALETTRFGRLSPKAELGVFALFLALYGVICHAAQLDERHYQALDSESLTFMAWVKQHTDADDCFLLLPEYPPAKLTPGQDESLPWPWEVSYFMEWFPTITGRRNISTVQGSEWAPEGEFLDAIIRYDNLSTCRTVDELHQVVDEEFDILFVPRGSGYEDLSSRLSLAEQYRLIYLDDRVGALYRRAE